jgi:electron transfer flavoprotein beta subunit
MDMKILVPIKQVADPGVNVLVKSNGLGVELQGVARMINPFCAVALEQAVQYKEKGVASEVVVVCVGEESVQDQLRSALAKGADRAVWIESGREILPLDIATILCELVKEEKPNLVLMGKQSIDHDNNQTGQMLAALLGWPQGTLATQITLRNSSVVVDCQVEDGIQTLVIEMPAVITVSLRLNTPRFASLPAIMKAKSRPLEVRKADDFGFVFEQHLEILEVYSYVNCKSLEMLDSVDALVSKLKKEVKVS